MHLPFVQPLKNRRLAAIWQAARNGRLTRFKIAESRRLGNAMSLSQGRRLIDFLAVMCIGQGAIHHHLLDDRIFVPDF
jgi:hypothetical protein